jgi:hypothetical protein
MENGSVFGDDGESETPPLWRAEAKHQSSNRAPLIAGSTELFDDCSTIAVLASSKGCPDEDRIRST